MPPPLAQLFVTCLVDSLFPEVGEATVAVLERAGVEVEFPFDQTCCGQPAFNAGYREEAAAMARHTLDVLDATDGQIVIPSGSCAEMICHHAAGLVSGDAEYEAKAARVARRTRELTQYLVDDVGITDLGASAGRVATYHSSCHGRRGLGLGRQAAALLGAVAGLDLVELPEAEACCGFGGIFSIELPEVSAAMLETKLANVAATGADVVVGGDVGCLMHMEGGLRRSGSPVTAIHIASLLAGDET